jgi:L-amino acid N-acyltransferase YncA
MQPELRLATEDDAAAMAEIYRPIVVGTPISFEIDPPDEREMRQRIRDLLPAYPWLVCAHRGDVVGYAYASRHRVRAAYQWSVDTSVYVHTAFQRRGSGRALYMSLFCILAAQGFFRAYAGITLPNPGSVALHEASGFEPVGVYRAVGHKLGRWHDVGWWQRSLQPAVVEPPPPLDLAAVRRTAIWERMLMSGLSCIRDEGSEA